MQNEAIIRIGAFIGVLAIMGAWELLSPRRGRKLQRGKRWLGNLGLVAAGTLLVRVVFALILPAAAVGAALVAEERGWGLFNAVAIPYWAAFVLSIFLLDLVIYLQHVLFHAVPALWRLHMVHHADLDLDVTSGVRFHPLEILISMGIKVAAVAAIGPPVFSVIAFEVLLNATAMFNHSNVYIPLSLDRVVRWFVVTPDMHRVHHSIERNETNSNFGFNFPWWDRALGTYRPQPAAGHKSMTIGLQQFMNDKTNSLWWMLIAPFRAPGGAYPINRRRTR